MRQINSSVFVLDEKYATTRRLTQNQPVIDCKLENKIQTQLFIPANDSRKGEGGLRTQGYFKTDIEKLPLITVITVVFNGENCLEETILNIIGQTYHNIEYIIIDGGSTDGTLDIIRRYENQIDYWISEDDKGIYDAMNKGIMAATGKWINFMNAGDYFYKDTAVADVVNDLEKSGEYTYYYGNHEVRYFEDSLRRIVDVAPCDDDLWRGLFFSHQTAFVTAEACKLYKFDVSIKLASDFDFFVKLQADRLKTKKINKTISSISASGVSDTQRDAVFREYILILLKYKEISKIKIYLYFYTKVLVFFIKRFIKDNFPKFSNYIFSYIGFVAQIDQIKQTFGNNKQTLK